MWIVDYPRLDYERRQHHIRYQKYVEVNGLACQECGMAGRVCEEMIGDWPRYEICGWCESTGLVTRWRRGLWLRSRRQVPHLS